MSFPRTVEQVFNKMKATLFILCYPQPSINDQCLAAISEYLGLNYKLIKPEDLLRDDPSCQDTKNRNKSCIAFSNETINALCQNNNLSLIEKLPGICSFVFVYNCNPFISSNDGLKILTNEVLESVSALSDNEQSYSIEERHREISKQFSGLVFGPVNSQVDFVFNVRKPSDQLDSIISINKRPMLARVKREGCSIFALATGKIQDVNEIENRSLTAANYFSTLIPTLMVLKYVFGDFCWHPVANQACLTIDDPLLHKKYGFLNYVDLLNSMNQDGYFTTMAFIPWNYRRTQREVAELFLKNSNRYSICVHGCDHTAREFGLTDFHEMDKKVKLATKRMLAHQKLTGLDFDKVMVFPQGVFSTASLKALKSNNFTAAVNSGVFPVDSGGLKIIDMLQQSVLFYESFALFHRRYPLVIADFAFDLFLGKPALIVTHHSHFKDGYKEISGFTGKINLLDADLKWRGLEEIARNSYWQKKESDTQIYLKTCSNILHIDNDFTDTVKYSIMKYETNNIPLEGILVNGQKIDYSIANHFLKFDIDIKPKASTDIVIKFKNLYTNLKEDTGMFEKVKIFTRRHLSEIRDDYISKI